MNSIRVVSARSMASSTRKSNPDAAIGAPPASFISDMPEVPTQASARRRVMGIALGLGVVVAAAIGVTMSGASNSDGTVGKDPDGGGTDGEIGDGLDVDVDKLLPKFGSNADDSGRATYAPTYFGEFNETDNFNATEAPTGDDGVRAGYLEACDPGVGFAHLAHPPCEDEFVCVTDNHYASWCITCDSDSDDFALQCMMVHPNARENTAAACNSAGCGGSKYAGRDERCNPTEDNSEFNMFKKCAPGLQCAVTEAKYTQCVVCQDPFWSEDCVFWKPDFLDAAKEICGASGCVSTTQKAARDARCSPTPEHEKFGNFAQCETGLRCATTLEYSQCISCDDSDYLQDCPYWEADEKFKKATQRTCQGAPECVLDGTSANVVTAKPDERCKTGADDMLFSEFPECDETGKCVSTGSYTQCVDCSNWEYDCHFWEPMFLEAAETTCGFEGKGCAQVMLCGNGASPDGDGNCVVDNGETCVPDELVTTDDAGVVDPTCRDNLECVVGDGATQCVDCNENFLYDCVYWEASFLAKAEETCQRKCTPLTHEEKSCEKDSDCGKKKHGWACVTTCQYSQCVQCFGNQFDWDCGFWEGSFLDAAETRCGKKCNPKTCPHDRTAAPTGPKPTSWPTTWSPTAKPTLGEQETTETPTASPTTWAPTASPSQATTFSPTTATPSAWPTTWTPTATPSTNATDMPTGTPTKIPTTKPTKIPSVAPSNKPTMKPLGDVDEV